MIPGEIVVVDANVLVSCFTSEEYTPQSDWLINSGVTLLAPDFIGIETSSAFLRKVRRGELFMADAIVSVQAIPDRVSLQASAPLWEGALTFAHIYGLSAYDALYVVLAQREGCELVTADTQVADVLREHQPDRLVWLGDLPTV